MTGPTARPLVLLGVTVNGDAVRTAVPAERTLLELLRYDLGLTGSKQGCDQGDCGACTVLVDGEPVLACLTLAVDTDGRAVDTIESLARGPRLHPLQDAFVRCGATQCGFCTPGMLMSAKAFLDHELAQAREPTREDIKHALSGNLCRCTGYTKIVDAVVAAARELAAARKAP